MTAQDQWTNRLSDYLDDELPPQERAGLEAHLASCAECAANSGHTRVSVDELLDEARQPAGP